MKTDYIKPVVEAVGQVPAAAILDGSIDASMESYGEQTDFTW